MVLQTTGTQTVWHCGKLGGGEPVQLRFLGNMDAFCEKRTKASVPLQSAERDMGHLETQACSPVLSQISTHLQKFVYVSSW